jgi:hypothetical protein
VGVVAVDAVSESGLEYGQEGLQRTVSNPRSVLEYEFDGGIGWRMTVAVGLIECFGDLLMGHYAENILQYL